MIGAPSILPLCRAAMPLAVMLLLLWVLRFRRVTCPATCRRCGYDVSHRPPGVERCSECGADLTARRAMRNWRRVRLGSSARWSFLLVLLGLAIWPAMMGRRFEWRKWYLATAPDRLIALQAEHPSGPLATDALAEWIERYKWNRLPAEARDRLFDCLLDWQADASIIWNPAMGDLLLEALQLDRLSDERADRFVNGAWLLCNLRTRPVIRAGDPIPVEFNIVERGGVSRRNELYLRGELFISLRGPPERKSERSLFAPFAPSAGAIHRGEQDAQTGGTANVSTGRGQVHVLVARALYSAPPYCEHRVSLRRQTLDVEILPANVPLGRPIADAEASAEAVARAVQISLYRHRSGQIYARVRLTPAAKVDRAFRVYADVGGRRLLVAERYAPAGQWDAAHDTATEVDELVPVDDAMGLTSLRICLVGSGEPLRHSVGQQWYWPGTITYTVPIEIPDEQQGPKRTGSATLPPYVIKRPE